MTNTPTPEQIAEMTAWMDDLPCCLDSPNTTGAMCKTCDRHAADMVRALAADRDAQKQRADAAELELHGPISDLTGADITNIIAHLSLELEPRGPLPTRNSVMMALIAAQNDLSAEKAKVARLVEAARPFAHVAELFDSEVDGVGAFDTLSLWLNGDDEEPAWRAMHFTLGDFGKLQAALAEVQE